jgi:hypothetical protein
MRFARTGLAAGAGVAVLAAGLLATGCDVQRAVDCARLAVAVANSEQAVEDAATTAVEGDDPAAFAQLARDVDELTDRVQDTDVRAAAEDVSRAAENVQTALEAGGQPDLTPLAEATDELTGVCAADPE